MVKMGICGIVVVVDVVLVVEVVLRRRAFGLGVASNQPENHSIKSERKWDSEGGVGVAILAINYPDFNWYLHGLEIKFAKGLAILNNHSITLPVCQTTLIYIGNSSIFTDIYIGIIELYEVTETLYYLIIPSI